MHRSEIRDLRTCAECGAELTPGVDREYAFGSEAFLCYACAVRRGGVYDEAHDRWLEGADTSGLHRGEG
jgi:hypothetical protein